MTFMNNLARADRAKVVATLRRAAEHVDRVGLHQGGLFGYDGLHDIERRDRLPCCGWGAVEIVESNFITSYAAEEALSLMVGPKDDPRRGHYPHWNDAYGRTKEEVVEKINETADTLEAGQYPFIERYVGVAP